MADLRSTVTTIFKADTSDAKAKVRELRGEQKKAAKEQLAEIEAQNRKIDEHIARWTKVGVVVGGAVAAYKAVQASVNSYIENTRLAESVGAISMERLRAATRGLIEDTDLMRSAAAQMHGAWKLNEGEIERVLRGASALQKKFGGDLQPIVDKLTKSIGKGLTEELKEFGIQAKDKEGVLRELDKAFASVGGNAEQAGDSIVRAKVSMANAMDELRTSIGQMVVAMAPLLESLADAIRLITGAIGAIASAGAAANSDRWLRSQAQRMGLLPGQQAEVGALQTRKWAQRQAEASALRDAAASVMEVNDALIMESAKIVADSAQKKEAIRKAAAKVRGSSPAAPDYLSMIGEVTGGAGVEVTDVFSGRQTDPLDSVRHESMVTSLSGAEEPLRQLAESFAQVAAFQTAASGQRRTILEHVFGTPTEINAMVIALDLARMTFDGLTESLAAGYDAWVTGAESVSAAFRKMLAQQIHALGRYMFIESVKHFGLAIIDFSGRHAAAGAALLAGSLVAGKVAQEMGAGASAPAGAFGGGGGGGGYLPRSGSSGDGGNTTIIHLGADYYEMTPAERRARLARAVDRGRSHRSSTVIDHR